MNKITKALLFLIVCALCYLMGLVSLWSICDYQKEKNWQTTQKQEEIITQLKQENSRLESIINNYTIEERKNCE